MNWIGLATKLPTLIAGAVQIVESVKGAKGPAKQQAVLDAVAGSVELAEYAAGKDLLNDPEVQKAARAFIDAKVALMNIVAKKQAA